ATPPAPRESITARSPAREGAFTRCSGLLIGLPLFGGESRLPFSATRLARSQACREQRCCDYDDSDAHRRERPIERCEQRLQRYSFASAVAPLTLAARRQRAPAEVACGSRQPPLREAHRVAASCDQDRRDGDAASVHEIARERRERAPSGGEPCVRVKAPARELEVIGGQE